MDKDSEPLARLEGHEIWRSSDADVDDEQRHFEFLTEGKIAALFVGVRDYDGTSNVVLLEHGKRDILLFTLRAVLAVLDREGAGNDNA